MQKTVIQIYYNIFTISFIDLQKNYPINSIYILYESEKQPKYLCKMSKSKSILSKLNYFSWIRTQITLVWFCRHSASILLGWYFFLKIPFLYIFIGFRKHFYNPWSSQWQWYSWWRQRTVVVQCNWGKSSSKKVVKNYSNDRNLKWQSSAQWNISLFIFRGDLPKDCQHLRSKLISFININPARGTQIFRIRHTIWTLFL